MNLKEINIESGVSAFDGKGFCLLTAVGENGEVLTGQLSPSEVRQMALDFICGAEAADLDAVVFSLLNELGDDERMAGAFLLMLRQRRGES